MIIYDRVPPRIEMDGSHFAIIPYEYPATRRRTIRVGSRSFREAGPAGVDGHWERAERSGQYYQEFRAPIIDHAVIRVHGDIDVHCYNGSREHYALLDTTFALVPPDHLRQVVAEKTAGFRLVNAAGQGASASYMGGLNPAFNYRSTDYDDRLAILITYGALWQNRSLGICPTALHEIGHVMTHRGNGLSIAGTDAQRHTELSEVRVSRNPGALEALCNAYMYLLCYGSSNSGIHNYGSRPVSIQKDRRTRDALRACPAFSELDEEWQQRFAER